MAKGRTKRPVRRPRASSADIIGPAEPKVKIPRKWSKHYRHLIEIRDQLLGRKDTLVQTAREEAPGFGLHIADAGTDNYDRDFALSMASSEQNALYEVEAALSRIRNKTYGTCELTGKPIEAERLAAVPWARFSAEAERRLEQDGAVGRARLNPRSELPRTQAQEEEEDV